MSVENAGESTKPWTLMDGLRLIADLLNTIRPETTKVTWKRFLKSYRPRAGSLISGPFDAWETRGRHRRASMLPSVTLDEARRVRQSIESDLRYLDFDHKGIPTTEHPLGPLLIKLNNLTKRSESASWQCRPLAQAKPARGQAVLVLRRRDRKGELRMKRWVTEFLPFGETKTLEEWLYAVLGRALLTGELGKLRLCRLCAKYLVVKSAKQEVCRECKITFQNRRRIEQGYFRENRQINKEMKERRRRLARENDAIELARQLKREGHGFQQIKEQTKLPDRDINRVMERNS